MTISSGLQYLASPNQVLFSPTDAEFVKACERGVAAIKLGIKDEVYDFQCGSTRVFELTREQAESNASDRTITAKGRRARS